MKAWFGLIFVLSVSLFFGFAVPKSSIAQIPFQEDSSDELSYLIVDQTKTPWGREFSKLFSQVWRSPKGIPFYVIKIQEERISVSRKQSLIKVLVGNNIYNYTVYSAYIRPTSSEIEDKVMQAVKKVEFFLLEKYPLIYYNMEQF